MDVCASRVLSYCCGRYAVPYLAVFTGVAGNWVLQLVIACEYDVLRLQAYDVMTRVPVAQTWSDTWNGIQTRTRKRTYT